MLSLIPALLLSLLSGQPFFQPPLHVSFFTNRSFKHYTASQKRKILAALALLNVTCTQF